MVVYKEEAARVEPFGRYRHTHTHFYSIILRLKDIHLYEIPRRGDNSIKTISRRTFDAGEAAPRRTIAKSPAAAACYIGTLNKLSCYLFISNGLMGIISWCFITYILYVQHRERIYTNAQTLGVFQIHAYLNTFFFWIHINIWNILKVYFIVLLFVPTKHILYFKYVRT